MSIDWLHFSPLRAVTGGLMIGASVAAFVALNGRIAGISGIVGGLLRPIRGDLSWRIAFVAGLAVAPLVYGLFAHLPEPRIDAGTATLALSGFLVGLGTRYGSGCTSGHGVCGLARSSPRSLAATAMFMAAGFATVFATRHVF